MPLNAILLDAIDLFDDLGLLVETRDLSRGVSRLRIAEGQSPFAFRRFNIGRQASGSLPVTLRGWIVTDEGLSRAAALTQLNTRIDRLKWRIRQQGSHTIRWEDIPDRFWDVEFEELRIRGPGANEFIAPAARVELITRAFDPRAKSTTETTIDGIVSAPDPVPIVLDIIPIGTAPIDGIVTIEGDTTTPLLTGWTLEYRDDADAVVKSLTWDGIDLATGDILVIDLADATVELNGSNAIDDLRVGSDLPILLDPNDGADDSFLDQIAGKVPDLRLDGSGDVNQFDVVYRARFW